MYSKIIPEQEREVMGYPLKGYTEQRLLKLDEEIYPKGLIKKLLRKILYIIRRIPENLKKTKGRNPTGQVRMDANSVLEMMK